MDSKETNILIECYGNPAYYPCVGASEEVQKRILHDDKLKKFYTLDKLPGEQLFISIKYNELECVFMFLIISSVKKINFTELIQALKNNTKYSIFNNYPESINTKDGFTYFCRDGIINDSRIQIKVPNKYCIDMFEKLINY